MQIAGERAVKQSQRRPGAKKKGWEKADDLRQKRVIEKANREQWGGRGSFFL
jgi:hypothetical protein